MSYILEALKKSQQERELGQVPTLDASGLFAEDKEPAPSNHWALLAVGLATLAVVIALYAAFRGADRPRETVAPVAVPPAAEAPRVTGASAALPSMGMAPPGAAGVPSQSTAIARDPSPLAPFIEAPPPKRVSREASVPPSPPADVADSAPLDEADVDPGSGPDPDLEQDLLRQLQAEQAAINATREVLGEPPRIAPVPDDLIQDIEAFKQQLRREQGMPPPESKRVPAKISGDPTRLRLTPAQQATLPGYLMTVHVYDADIAKRFVVINTLKYREGEETREGIRVERILKDGAVLSYLGNPFYIAR